MKRHTAFLATIESSPHDDFPKLVMADWLEEQEDGLQLGIRWMVHNNRHPKSDVINHFWWVEGDDSTRTFELPSCICDVLKSYELHWFCTPEREFEYERYIYAYLDCAKAVTELIQLGELDF